MYDSENFQALGIDCWDGDASKVESFKNRTGITYPLLMMGSSVQEEYEVPYDYSMVIDQNGTVQYRSSGVNVSQINETIENLLTTSVDNKTAGPIKFDLVKNYPNPFNPRTTIEFNVDELQIIQLNILDSRGRLVRNLKNERLPSGSYSVVWNGTADGGGKVASGIYFAQLKGELYTKTLKLILLQ